MKKSELRDLVRARLSNLPQLQKKEQAQYVAKQVSNLINKRNYKNICIYSSIKNEIATTEIINYLYEKNLNVYLPVVNGEEMNFYLVKKDCQFKTGAFNIKEPISNIKLNKCDCCVVPLLAFDKSLNRLGKGKGYYDRFFQNNKCYKIAIAYNEQLVDNIQAEAHDIKMDCIITQEKIYNESNNR